jgi:hypothetical protein
MTILRSTGQTVSESFAIGIRLIDRRIRGATPPLDDMYTFDLLDPRKVTAGDGPLVLSCLVESRELVLVGIADPRVFADTLETL